MRKSLVPVAALAATLLAATLAYGDVGETVLAIRQFFAHLGRTGGAAAQTGDVVTLQADGTVLFSANTGGTAFTSSGSSTVTTGPLDLGGYALYGDVKNVVGSNNAGQDVYAAQSGTLFYDTAGAGTMIYDLPSATAGLHYYFARRSLADNYLQVQARGTDTITHLGVVSAAGSTYPSGGYIRVAAVGGTVHIVCVTTGKWITLNDEGNWEVDGAAEAGGSSSGFTISFTASLGVQPAGVTGPSFTTRNSHSVLAFDASTQQTIDFEGVMPSSYTTGSNATAIVEWCAASATSGDVVWLLSFEDMNALDVDADSFATAVSVTSTANGTSGVFSHATFTLSNANLDGMAAGSAFRVRLVRKAADAADTMTGNAQAYSLRISQ